jgi:hypothetical protein
MLLLTFRFASNMNVGERAFILAGFFQQFPAVFHQYTRCRSQLGVPCSPLPWPSTQSCSRKPRRDIEPNPRWGQWLSNDDAAGTGVSLRRTRHHSIFFFGNLKQLQIHPLTPLSYVSFHTSNNENHTSIIAGAFSSVGNVMHKRVVPSDTSWG